LQARLGGRHCREWSYSVRWDAVGAGIAAPVASQIMKAVLGKLNNELLINLTIRASPFCSHVESAIAYAEGSDHPLLRTCKQENLRLVFYGLLDEHGAVSVPL